MSVPYTRAQIRLHWAIFVLIALQFVFSDSMSAAWRAFRRGEEVTFDAMVLSHVAIGGLVLLLVIWRLVLRARIGAPPLPEEEPTILKVTASATHVVLYLLMVILPVSGMVAWFGGVEAAGEAHEIAKTLLLVLVALHVVGALYQQFVLKTNIMQRMKRPGDQL